MASDSKKDGSSLKKLEELSIVSKVCMEIESHLGFSDEVLAEFITQMGRECETLEEFVSQLKKKGADELFPDCLLRTLFTVTRVNVLELERRERDGEGMGNKGERRRDWREEKGKGEVRSGRNQSGGAELYQVYKGRVSRVMDTGCFVQLNHITGKEGLVHVSQMATRRIANAKDGVKRGQEVYVKVISISGQKLSLSMQDVDQNTGKDLLPLNKRSNGDAFWTNPSGRANNEGPTTRTGLSGIRVTDECDVVPSCRPLKRMSSPEKWEAKQLIAAGVLDVREDPMYDEETEGILLYQEEGAEEELEIELNEDEPTFLRGQSRYSMDMSPVKIFKNPECSL